MKYFEEFNTLVDIMRKKRDENIRLLTISNEEKKKIQYEARASLLENLLQETAFIKKDIERKRNVQ